MQSPKEDTSDTSYENNVILSWVEWKSDGY